MVRVRITTHARQRMARYGIPQTMVHGVLGDPDQVLPGHSGRMIAQKALNGYVLRMVDEEEDGVIVVVTV
jgi:hypothetical protein